MKKAKLISSINKTVQLHLQMEHKPDVFPVNTNGKNPVRCSKNLEHFGRYRQVHHQFETSKYSRYSHEPLSVITYRKHRSEHTVHTFGAPRK